MGAALNEVLRRIRHELDQMVRTGGHTFAAGHTFLLIDNSHTVNHVNRIEGAGLDTGTVSHTAVDAGFLSGARNDRDLLAVIHAVVVVLDLRLIAGTQYQNEPRLALLLSAVPVLPNHRMAVRFLPDSIVVCPLFLLK